MIEVVRAAVTPVIITTVDRHVNRWENSGRVMSWGGIRRVGTRLLPIELGKCH